MYNTIAVAENQYLIDISPTGKIRPWRVNKLQNQLLSVAYEEIDELKAERLRQCATNISFKVDVASGRKTLHSANFCRVRLCPVCQWRRGLKVFGQTSKIMKAIEADRPMSYIFVTLTLKNCDGNSLGKTIDNMMTAWNRMQGRKAVKQAVKGYYRGLEVTHNTDISSSDYNTFHPHFHAVFAVNPSYFSSRDYISQSAWTSLWKKSMQLDYTPIVDVRRVKGSTAAAVAEAAKYSVKPGDYIIPDDWDLTVETVQLLDTVLNKRRFTAYGGLFSEWHKKLNLDDSDEGDLIHTDSDEDSSEDTSAPKYWYAWRTGYSQYCRVITPHE